MTNIVDVVDELCEVDSALKKVRIVYEVMNEKHLMYVRDEELACAADLLNDCLKALEKRIAAAYKMAATMLAAQKVEKVQ